VSTTRIAEYAGPKNIHISQTRKIGGQSHELRAKLTGRFTLP
jgi:hypothetical protein